MPPKTLDQLTATGAAIFDPECMRNEPALAAKIAECIARWSNTEAVLGSLLARLMDSTDLTATAVYRNAGSWPARIKVLEAAAALKLDPDDNKLFGHILTLVRKAADKRHDLAHRVWGWCPELPGSLLLARPSVMPKWHTQHYLAGKGVPVSGDWGDTHRE